MAKKTRPEALPDRSWWSQSQEDTLKAGPHYDRAAEYPRGVVGPTPRHALTDAAEAARAAVRSHRQRQRLTRAHTALPVPWREVPLELVTGAARAWLVKAQAAGGEVKAVMAGTAVMLVVRSPRIRATWVDGHTVGCTGLGRKLTLAEALAATAEAAS